MLRRVPRRRALNDAVRKWQEEVDEQTKKEMDEILQISREKSRTGWKAYEEAKDVPSGCIK